jgi:hypothetical protein
MNLTRNLALLMFVLVGLRGIASDHEIGPKSYYRLTNSYLGPGRSLDTSSVGGNDLFMGQTGNYSGQFWKLTPLSDGTYRLTNSYLGTSRALDTYSDTDNRPFMGKTDQDYSGQHWTLAGVDSN